MFLHKPDSVGVHTDTTVDTASKASRPADLFQPFEYEFLLYTIYAPLNVKSPCAPRNLNASESCFLVLSLHRSGIKIPSFLHQSCIIWKFLKITR